MLWGALSVGFQGECKMHEWLWRSWLREVGDGAYTFVSARLGSSPALASSPVFFFASASLFASAAAFAAAYSTSARFTFSASSFLRRGHWVRIASMASGRNDHIHQDAAPDVKTRTRVCRARTVF